MLYHSKMSSLPLVFFFSSVIQDDFSFSYACILDKIALGHVIFLSVYKSLQTVAFDCSIEYTIVFQFANQRNLSFSLPFKPWFKNQNLVQIQLMVLLNMFKCNLTMVSHTNLHICIIYFFWWSIFFLSFIHILDVGGVLIEITYCHTHSYYNL